MYVLIDKPVLGACGSLLAVLEQVCTVYVTESDDGDGWDVTYRFIFCLENTRKYSYSKELTQREVYEDFFKTRVLEIAKRNGYVLFKEVE